MNNDKKNKMKKNFAFLLLLLSGLLLFRTTERQCETPQEFLTGFVEAMEKEPEGGDPLEGYYFKEVNSVYVRYEQQYSNHSTIWVFNELSKGENSKTLGYSIKHRLSKNVYRHIRSDIKNGYVKLAVPFKEVSYKVYPPVLGVENSLETRLSKNEIETLSQYFFDLFSEIGGTSTSKDRGALDNIIVYPNGDFMFLDCYPSAKYQDEVYGAALYVKKYRGKYYLDTAYYFSQRLEYP